MVENVERKDQVDQLETSMQPVGIAHCWQNHLDEFKNGATPQTPSFLWGKRG
jgi:hypothetical protein